MGQIFSLRRKKALNYKTYFPGTFPAIDESMGSKPAVAFLLSNPFFRGMVELGVLVLTGTCGLAFTWTKFSIFPLSHIAGGALILFGLVFHCWTEKGHKMAHEQSRAIEKLVTTGVYSRIRHPLYLSIIVMNVGIALAFGVMLTFLIALLTIVHWIATALAEEGFLLRKFPDEYRRYKQAVRWRMIPGIF
jgi:protein-S-isoprenylcysteine O-methyltransferase Ste14